MSATRFVLLSWILFLTRASSELHVTKCCPPGKVFLENVTLECVSVPNAIEFHIYQWNTTMEIQGIPQCDASEDLMMTPFHELNSLTMPACVGTLYDQITGKNIGIVVHCGPSEDRQAVAINSSSSQFLVVRKCCPSDKVFDSRTKTCVDRLSELENLAAFLLNRLDDAERAVMVTTQGPPACKGGPFVDYEIDENDVFLQNETRVVMAPVMKTSVKGIVEETKANSDSGCLEMSPNFVSNRTLVARICDYPKFCNTSACIRKCCPENEFFLAENKTAGKSSMCGKPTTSDEPTKFYKALANVVNQTNSTFDTAKDYGVLILNPCKYMYAVDPRKKNKGHGQWLLTLEGHVLFEDDTYQYEDNVSKEYCMDFYEKPEFNTFHLYMCIERTFENSIRWPAAWVISCICLLITLLVYTCLPSLRNLHGKTFTCYIISLLLGLIFTYINTRFTYRNSTEEHSRITCKVLASIEYFFEISILFWLNIMCFDIWRTFGTIRENMIMKRKYRKRFLLYCLYVWGSSFLLSIFPIVASSMDILPDYFKLNVDELKCFVAYTRDSYSEIIWYFGPLTILLISNVVFVILTSMSSNKVKTELKRVNTDSINYSSKKFHSNRERFVMNVKLFILTGVFMFCALIKFFLRKYFDDGSWLINMFIYIDLFYRSFEGLLIFILFVLKKRVYQEFRQRLGLQRKNQPDMQRDHNRL